MLDAKMTSLKDKIQTQAIEEILVAEDKKAKEVEVKLPKEVKKKGRA